MNLQDSGILLSSLSLGTNFLSVRQTSGILPRIHCAIAAPLLHVRSLQKDWDFMGKKVTLKLWNIIYQIWTSRNAFLHETGAIDRVSGLAQLQQAITAEHARRPGYLHQVYNRYFRHPLPSLLASSVASQKEWFLVIRTAQEATDLFAYDAFANFSLAPCMDRASSPEV